ncbi:hypothetical protein [Longitalea luteola]|uniref:hypothetical protein n=1 Tax=Longitalea luteola TaxID=2812563 RepID=UPI001A960CB9|nr:hypothetical protein [Longitalea luteola]
MKKPGFIIIFLLFTFLSKAQPGNCILRPSQFTIHFGSGNVRDPNTANLSNYWRVAGSCPSDGHYSFVSYTSRCFSDDWHTLSSDHTAGDADGNMLLVNAAPDGGTFMNIPVIGLKSNTQYELALWVINLCKPTKKCPSILLPSLNIRLETTEGRPVANIVTKDLPRIAVPVWEQHRAYFTTPASPATLRLVMANHVPGGCGNDFAIDDITFRECVKKPVAATQKTPAATKRFTASKTVTPKTTTFPQKKVQPGPVIKPKPVIISKTIEPVKQSTIAIPVMPLVLKNRENTLVKKIETEAGEINISCYDNGEIDDDTVSIYHNNKLIKSKMRLSEKPISFAIAVNEAQSHHELIMVAENLGSIPPNTSVMVINTPGTRYEVFISSSRQKNAKVVFDLKK